MDNTGFIMPEIIIQRVLQQGIAEIRNDINQLDKIFATYNEPSIQKDYGSTYINSIKTWFSATKIPIVQQYQFNAQRIPSISVKYGVESEDEGKAAVGDHFEDDVDFSIHTLTLTNNLDIEIHGRRNSEESIWLYYITIYILMRYKQLAYTMGLKLSTFSASESQKASQYDPENIWTRYIRFKCTTENFIDMAPFGDPVEGIEVDLYASSTETGKEEVDI